MASYRRIAAIARKNLLVLLKDRRTVGLLIFMPILMMILFGYAFGSSVKHVPIKVVNLDKGGPGVPLYGIEDTEFSDEGITFLDEDDRVDIEVLKADNFDLDEEKSKVYGGHDYFALVVFPDNFGEDFPNINIQINLTIYIDGSEPQVIASVRAAIADMLNHLANKQTGDDPHINLDFDYIYGNEDLRPVDTMAAGVLGFAILLFMMLTVTGGFTKERITGTLCRVFTNQTSKMEIVLGYILGNSLIALIQSALLLIIGVFVFQLTVNGSLLLLFLMLFLYAVTCVGIGIFLSTFAQTELQAFQFIPLTIIPFMFFSGFIFPLTAFPKFFQYLSYIIPMTYSIRINRAIMINGFGIDMFLMDFFALLGLTVLYITLAIVGFKIRK